VDLKTGISLEKDEVRFLIFLSAITILTTFLAAHFFAGINGQNALDIHSVWDNWDAKNYAHIAAYGYSARPDDFYRIAFLPGYPAIIGLLGILAKDLTLAGLFVSNFAFVAAIFLFYKLIRLDFPKDTAKRAAILFCVFPTAYFLHAPYTESVFILFSIASFYKARLGEWKWAGLLGMIAAATRINGVLLLVGLAAEYFAQRKWDLKQLDWNAAFLLLVPLGLLPYLAVNSAVFGDPLAFLSIQSTHFHKAISIPYDGLVTSWLNIINTFPESPPVAAIEIVFAFIGYAFALMALAKTRFSYGVYALASVVFFTSTAYWMSNPRYVLCVFPVFISMALAAKEKNTYRAFIAVSALLQALFLFWYATGKWAF
jgi:hypothetical protein